MRKKAPIQNTFNAIVVNQNNEHFGKLLPVTFPRAGTHWVATCQETQEQYLFALNEISPLGGYIFNEDKTNVVSNPAPSFVNGDPFALIPEGFSRTANPILIETVFGSVVAAYPVAGFIGPCGYTFVPRHTKEHQRVFWVVTVDENDRASYDAMIHIGSRCHLEERFVKAWSLFPQSLTAQS